MSTYNFQYRELAGHKKLFKKFLQPKKRKYDSEAFITKSIHKIWFDLLN